MRWLLGATAYIIVTWVYAMWQAVALGSATGWGLVAALLGTLWLAASTDEASRDPEANFMQQTVLPPDDNLRRIVREIGWALLAIAFLMQFYDVMAR